DDDAVSKPGEHGRRRDDKGKPARRSRAAGRMRQDDAGAVDGSGELRSAFADDFRRSDAQRKVSRRGHRFGYERLAVQRRRAPRHDEHVRFHGRGVVHESFGGTLHDYGHGFDDGERSRSAWYRAAYERGNTRGRLSTIRACSYGRTSSGGDGKR